MSERVHVGRAELVLARDDNFPLRSVPLDPDPLTELVRAMGSVRPDLGERAAVVADLLAVTAGERRRRRRAAVAAERQPGAGGRDAIGWRGWRELLYGDPTNRGRGGETTSRVSRPPAGTIAGEEHRREHRAVAAKVLGHEPVFWLQLLVRTQSTVAGREAALLQEVIAGFAGWAGENYLRVAGWRLGPWFVGADSPWRRRRFDRRWTSGLHRPARAQLVTAGEIGGLLKPPTARCRADHVARSGGVIPPAPRELPTYSGQADLIPLGWVATNTGDRPTGVRVADTLFSYAAGRSAAGKTWSALGRFLALVRAGHGGLFLDPHRDAVEVAKEYLGDQGGRLWELDLSDAVTSQAGWNPLSMHGLSTRHIEAKVSAIVDSFAAALEWGERNNRALTLTTMAAQSLCELSLRLPAGLSPTIFQITTLLSDDDWRVAMLPYLSAQTRQFWEHRFSRLASDAITPVTNLVDRMRMSPTVAALLGAPRSTYDVRRAMDRGLIVLWSIAGAGAWSQLISCFVTNDLFRAAMSRTDLAPARRRPFYAFLDELQKISGTGSGSAGEAVARSLEETRKMGLRLQLMSQQPTRLAAPTLEAILTNRSHLMSYTVGAKSAKLLTGEWGDSIRPATITRLEKYHFVAQVTLDGKLTNPFKARGFDLDELFADHHRPNLVAGLTPHVNANLRRRPVVDVVAELATLDERIVGWLHDHHPRSAGPEFDDPEIPVATRPARRRADGTALPLDTPTLSDGSADTDPPEDSGPDNVVTLNRRSRR